MYKHDTTLKMAFGANFFWPILIPDPLLELVAVGHKEVVSVLVELVEC